MNWECIINAIRLALENCFNDITADRFSIQKVMLPTNRVIVCMINDAIMLDIPFCSSVAQPFVCACAFSLPVDSGVAVCQCICSQAMGRY